MRFLHLRHPSPRTASNFHVGQQFPHDSIKNFKEYDRHLPVPRFQSFTYHFLYGEKEVTVMRNLI